MRCGELEQVLEDIKYKKSGRMLYTYFPDEGPYRRELYKKHLEFFRLGLNFEERCILGGNRAGKTVAVLYEAACHAIGKYPPWWEGKRFDCPVVIWVCGRNRVTVRDILQRKLLGEINDLGTGLIPRDNIVGKPRRSAGIADAIDTIYIKHVSGQNSTISFKTYDQGKRAFEGSEVHFVVCDEEPDEKVYEEALMRTMTVDGRVVCSFTPTEGYSSMVQRFDKRDIGDEKTSQVVIRITWDDVPHLDDKKKERMAHRLSDASLQSRMRGIADLGYGRVYHTELSKILCKPFDIPSHWERTFGMDVGWANTAVVWLARDPHSGEVFAYDERIWQMLTPDVIAKDIRMYGDWMLGAIDPAARQTNKNDGTNLMDIYLSHGVQLSQANNHVKSGISKVAEMFENGSLKIFDTMNLLKSEYVGYLRNKDGGVKTKRPDHLMDALRYGVVTGLYRVNARVSATQEVANYYGY